MQIRKGLVALLMGFSFLMAQIEAMAALPTEATAAFTTLSGNVTDILAAVWPIAALATGGFILLKLFKKGARSAV